MAPIESLVLFVNFAEMSNYNNGSPTGLYLVHMQLYFPESFCKNEEIKKAFVVRTTGYIGNTIPVGYINLS